MSDDPYARLARLYDLEHDTIDDDVELYEALARSVSGPVLEIGCGTGRVVRALARAGHQVVGLDRSPPMLAVARQRSIGFLPEPRFVEGDVRSMTTGEKFGLVIFALDTFAHLVETADQLTALNAVRTCLQSNGRVVLDLSAPDPATWLREDNLVVVSWSGEDSGERVQKFYARTVDETAQTQTIRFWYDRWTDDGSVRRTASELTLRYFYPPEIQLVFEHAGFEITQWYGDWTLESFSPESPRLIVVAQPKRRRR